jgi:hypothetical protein
MHHIQAIRENPQQLAGGVHSDQQHQLAGWGLGAIRCCCCCLRRLLLCAAAAPAVA